MADVFISYSRKDIEFAQRVHHELEARDRQPWADWQDIPPTAEWLDEVYAGIQAAELSSLLSALIQWSPRFVFWR